MSVSGRRVGRWSGGRGRGGAVRGLAAQDYKWLGDAAPETTARELVFRLMTAQHALRMALGAEKRAQAFFEHVLLTADDPALRALAREMAAEEQEHVQGQRCEDRAIKDAVVLTAAHGARPAKPFPQ